MSNEKLLNRISELCKEKGINQTTAYIESGVGKNFKSNMKTSNPSIGKITMLANYFNVSTEYLMGETDKKESPLEMSERDSLALKAFRSLTVEEQEFFLSLMRSRAEKQKDESR